LLLKDKTVHYYFSICAVHVCVANWHWNNILWQVANFGEGSLFTALVKYTMLFQAAQQ